MIHAWELVMIEVGLPIVGFYFGSKRHWMLGVLLAFFGFCWAEYALYSAVHAGLVVR